MVSIRWLNFVKQSKDVINILAFEIDIVLFSAKITM